MNITIPMYEKGRSFILAGGLLKAYEGHRFVYFHLICQGVENIFKAVLLAYNYDTYQSKIACKPFGHDLDYISNEVFQALNITNINLEFLNEIKELNMFYKKHDLRYGSSIDNPSSNIKYISGNTVHKKMVQIIRILNKYIYSNNLKIEAKKA